MKRTFIYQDFKSQKFWSIDILDTTINVNYGKLGTSGQTQVKEYASAEEAIKAGDKLIAEKTKKGYVETATETAMSMKVEAKKYGLSYDDFDNGKGQVDILNKMLKDKKFPEIKQLTIGCWDFESGDCQELVDGIISNKDKFAHIEGLFWGDIESEETEISWIEQTDLSGVIDAMPKLNNLKIKGTNSLSIGKKTLPELKSLEIITGGLPSSVIKNIEESSYPNLEKLVLYVGVEDYGFEGDTNVFKPLLSKAKYPKLKYLGITNAENQVEILDMILQSDILPQLETLDISCGVFKDNGGQLLLDNVDKIKHLKLIDISYNFLSDDMKKKLSKLPCKIDVSDSQEIEMYDDEEYSYPMITE